MLFFFLYVQLSCYIIFLLLRELLETFLIRQVQWQKSPLIFVWENIPSLLLEDNFAGYRTLGGWVFCFVLFLLSQCFKYLISLFSCLHVVWGEVECHSYLHSTIGKDFLPPLTFLKTFFIFYFLQFEKYMLKGRFAYLFCFIFVFILLSVLWDFWLCGLVSDINLKKFTVIIVLNIYSVPFFCFPFGILSMHLLYPL